MRAEGVKLAVMNILSQQSIKYPAQISGVGLHTGKSVHVKLKPASAGTGIVFVRTDMRQKFPVMANRVQQTPLCTLLKNSQGETLSTVEHLMSALSALGVDNLIVEVDGPELPILDGSAAPWVALLDKGKLEPLDAPKEVLVVEEDVQVEMDGKVAIARPHQGFEIELEIDYDHPQLPHQTGKFSVDEAMFRKEVAKARTFCLKKDIDAMRAAGLIKGGTLECAVVFDDDGPVGGTKLNYPDEALRHKLLDAIGDLYMEGKPIVGSIYLKYPGHALNNALLKEIVKRFA